MRWCAIFFGCYGFVVGSAHAVERWSESCQHLEEMKVGVGAMSVSVHYKAIYSIPILINQHVNCGVENKKEYDAAAAVAFSMVPVPAKDLDTLLNTKKRSPAPAPRQPIFCDTTSKADGGSTTDCF
jgi:hypothetical protein